MSLNTKTLAVQRRLSIITIGAVYLLILVGGIVRSSGAGMGCPDWPKCFGKWVPPTSADQLPANYKQLYSEKRHEKNLRFARYLDALGMESTSQKLRSDPAVREETSFNPLKTWIEYVNRLVGVAIGFLILATFLHSFKLRKVRPVVFWLCAIAFAGVVFQGWIGSIVVSTNLLPGMISFHMLLALLIVVLLIAARYYSFESEAAIALSRAVKLRWLLVACMVTFLVQMIVGISIRENVDAAVAGGVERTEILERVGNVFLFHRSFSWLLLIGQLAVLYLIGRRSLPKPLLVPGITLTALVVVEIVSGALMGYFAIPAVIQPLHLLVASAIFGFQAYLFLLISPSNQSASTSVA